VVGLDEEDAVELRVADHRRLPATRLVVMTSSKEVAEALKAPAAV
jgi:hypothetical protein